MMSHQGTLPDNIDITTTIKTPTPSNYFVPTHNSDTISLLKYPIYCSYIPFLFIYPPSPQWRQVELQVNRWYIICCKLLSHINGNRYTKSIHTEIGIVLNRTNYLNIPITAHHMTKITVKSPNKELTFNIVPLESTGCKSILDSFGGRNLIGQYYTISQPHPPVQWRQLHPLMYTNCFHPHKMLQFLFSSYCINNEKH